MMNNVILLAWVVCSAIVNVCLALFFSKSGHIFAYLIEIILTFAVLFWESGVGLRSVLTGALTAALIAAVSWIMGAGVGSFL